MSACEHDATGLAARLARGEISAAGLLEERIADIEARDPGIGAFACRDFDRARAAAARADMRLGRGERAPLLGVPMAIKESFDMEGLPTSWGLSAYAGAVAARDAVAVARLREAGAVLVGKANVSEALAGQRSDNPVYGRTENPRAPGFTPGGSSSGSAAAVAAGLVPLALASDLGGSTRVPAHFCGVFGHDPTAGLVPLRGHSLEGRVASLDQSAPGVIAASARDLALALEVMAGPDAPEAAALRLSLPPPRHRRLRDVRALVLDRHPLLPTEPEVAAATRRLAARLAAEGATLREADGVIPDVAEATRVFATLLSGALALARTDAEREAERLELAGRPPGDRGLGATLLRASLLSHADWVVANEARAKLRLAWEAVFRDHDVVLCPPAHTAALPHAQASAASITVDGIAVPRSELIGWSAISKAGQLPATVMPEGATADGRPVGVQIIGPAFEDATPIAIARLLSV